MTENNPKDMVQYCYNPTTKEIVEAMYPPNEQFIQIIGYFKKGTDPVELRRIFEEIASRWVLRMRPWINTIFTITNSITSQENALDYDEYSGEQAAESHNQPNDKGSPTKD